MAHRHTINDYCINKFSIIGISKILLKVWLRTLTWWLLHEDRWFKFLFLSNTRKSYLFLEHFNVMNSMFLSLLAAGMLGIKYVVHLQQLCNVRHFWLIFIILWLISFCPDFITSSFSTHYMLYIKNRRDNWSNDVSTQCEQ